MPQVGLFYFSGLKMGEGGTIFLFLVCTAAMFTLPILTFFGVRDVLENEFDVHGFASTAW